jgi:hypothetical protein
MSEASHFRNMRARREEAVQERKNMIKMLETLASQDETLMDHVGAVQDNVQTLVTYTNGQFGLIGELLYTNTVATTQSMHGDIEA